LTVIIAERGLLQEYASGAHNAIAEIKTANPAMNAAEVFLFIVFLLTLDFTDSEQLLIVL
jgi:hypothetical protein